jgi:hypothetical protein
MFLAVVMVCGITGIINPYIISGCAAASSPPFKTEVECLDFANFMVSDLDLKKPEGSYVADFKCVQLQDTL